MEDCIFCKVVKNEIPSEKIYEDNLVLAFLDVRPVNIGHTLIIPKSHFENIHDLPLKTAAHIMKISKKINTALKKTGADGTTISMNNGVAAGQTVFHQHTHIIPRFKKDNLPPWPKKRPTEKNQKETAKRIISAIPS